MVCGHYRCLPWQPIYKYPHIYSPPEYIQRNATEVSRIDILNSVSLSDAVERPPSLFLAQ